MHSVKPRTRYSVYGRLKLDLVFQAYFTTLRSAYRYYVISGKVGRESALYIDGKRILPRE